MTPEHRQDLYRRVFLHNPDGAKVLEDLSSLFYDVDVFVKGQDGVTETAYKAGRRSAVGFIMAMTSQPMEQHDDN